MSPRDRLLLFGLVALALALACLTLVGVHSDVLLSVPVLFVVLPLLVGRYVGEERLTRLAAGYASSPDRPAGSLTPTVQRGPRLLPRGGRLIASSLAQRPPPVLVLPTA